MFLLGNFHSGFKGTVVVEVMKIRRSGIVVTSHERSGVSKHRQLDCLFSSLIRLTTQKSSNLRITGPLWGNPPVTRGFPSQRSINAKKRFRVVTSWSRLVKPQTMGWNENTLFWYTHCNQANGIHRGNKCIFHGHNQDGSWYTKHTLIHICYIHTYKWSLRLPKCVTIIIYTLRVPGVNVSQRTVC